MERGYTTDGTGGALSPLVGVVPVLKRIGDRRYAVVGTGFFVTRYGLFVTAKHVVSDITNSKGELTSSLVLHEGRIE